MGGVVSVSKSPEDTWLVAGWAFRQLLEDVTKNYAHDPEVVEGLEKAELHYGLILDSLERSLADRITEAVSNVVDGILNNTIQSGIEDRPYGDEVTLKQYFEALRELSQIIKRTSTKQGNLSAS